MNITSVGGANTGVQPGMNMGNYMQTDAVSKNIQNQIANAQKKLQEVSANQEMSLEDKMKKRQEIQQEITNLNQQLRQHQMEQRKEKQQKAASMDDMLGKNHKSDTIKASGSPSGLSRASMQAMISADGSMKQAQVQGAMAAKMEGKAGVLESEIKMDKGRGGNTEAKEAELEDLQERTQAATASQISTLAEANKTMEEAAKADQEAGEAEKKADKTEGKSDKNKENKMDSVTSDENTTENVSIENFDASVEQVSTTQTVSAQTVSTQTASQPASHISVDIRL